MNLIPKFPSVPTTKEKELKRLVVFKNILEKSMKMVSQWGGRLYFVNLPSKEMATDKKNEYLQQVFRVANDLHIPIIDMYTEVFESHPDPHTLFAAHYNAEGYRLVAEAISKRLIKDGVIPSDSNN